MERKQYYPDRQAYWNEVEAERTAHPLGFFTGLPDWCFEFISIHRDRFPRNPLNPFSLISPLMLCEQRRPRFEQRRFETYDDAKRYALRLAEIISRRFKMCHVVSCCNESLKECIANADTE